MKRIVVLWLVIAVVASIGRSVQAVWLEQDIGRAGNPAFTQILEHDPASGTFTVYGGGDDIYGNEDEFHFVYEDVPLIGDAVIQARVTALDVTNTWSKAGVMIRNALTDVSPNAAAVISGDPRMSFQYRALSGLGTTHITTTGPPVGEKPYWVRLTRFGDTLTGYRSPDGENWTLQGSVDIEMIAPYIGMAVTSHDNTQLAAAMFDNVSTARAATQHTWTGGSGSWNTNSKWNPAGVPDEMSKVTVNAGTVNVTDYEAAFALEMNGGTVVLAAGKSLDIAGRLHADDGTISMGADSELSFEYGGGTLGTLTFTDTAAVLPSGLLEVQNLRTNGSGAQLVVEGGGTLRVDSLTVRPDTELHVDGGVLSVGGAIPLGGSTKSVMLGGGTIQIRGSKDPTPAPGLPTIPGLRLHLDAGAIAGVNDGETIDQWDDLSGNNNHATLSRGTPVYRTDANGDGYAAVEFSAGAGMFTPLSISTHDYSVFIVFDSNQDSGVARRAINGNANFLIGPYGGPIGFHMGGWAYRDSAYMPIDQLTVAEVSNSTAGWSFYVDGLERAAGGGSRGGPGRLSFGEENAWSEPLLGDIAEVLVYNSALSEADRSDVRYHLQQKYGTGPLGSLDLPNTHFVVTEDSGIDAVTDGDAAFGTLTLKHGIITTSGVPMSFAATVLAPDATAIGVDPRTETDFGIIDGSGPAGPFVFSKGGPLNLNVEAGYLTNMQNATIDAHEGTLTMVGKEAWAGSTEGQLSGGTLNISGAIIGVGDGPANPQAYYSFDDQGNPGEDSGPIGYPGSLRNGAAWTFDGVRGGGLRLDGVNDWVRADIDVSETAYASAMWFRADADNGGLFSAHTTDLSGDCDRHLFLTGGNMSTRTWNNEVVTSADLDLADGEWHHVAHTYGGDQGGQKLYIDGVLVAQGNKANSDYHWQTSIHIGFSNDAANDFFSGTVDEVYIYDRALSAADIDAIIATRATPNMTGHSLTAVADSTLRASTAGAVTFAALTIEPDVVLTTEGSPIGFNTVSVAGDGEAAVGFHSDTDTTLTGIDGGGRELIFEIDGSARTIVNRVGTGLENATFELYGGELVGLIDATGTTFGEATLSFNGGGLMLGSTGGNQTFDVPLAVEGSGTFGVGEVPGGVSDAEITYGSAANGITINNQGVLQLRATDGYTLVVDGPLTGDGGIDAVAGIVDLNDVGAKDYTGGTGATGGTLNVNAPIANTSHMDVAGGTVALNAALSTGPVSVTTGGTVNVNPGGSLNAEGLTIGGGSTIHVGVGGSVTADTLAASGGGVYDTQVPSSFRTVTLRGGGTVLTNGNSVRVSESLVAGNYTLAVDPGGDFRVMGEDLAAGFDALALGGDVTFNGPRAPIAHWTFDDGAGDTAVNSADPSLNGTLIGLGTTLPAWSTRGQIDGAVILDGNGYVDLPDGFADFSGGITVAAWVYHTAYPSWGRIIDFGNGPAVDNILLAHVGTTGDARWQFDSTAGGSEQLSPNGVFQQWDWQHIVATCDDGPTDGAVMRLYRDGELLFEEGAKSVPANVVRTNNYIGDSNYTGDAFFQGYIDEMLIWDRELTEQEVIALHAAGAAGEPAPDFTLVSLDGTLSGSGTLRGDLTLGGTIAPGKPAGGGSGSIGFSGDARMTEETLTILTLDADGMSQLANAGNSDFKLQGELQYRVEGIDAADEGKDVSVTIVTALSEGVIQGTFDVVPPGSTATPAHIEAGVFHKGLTYHDAFPPTTPPSYFSIETTLRVAQGGDANGDGRVDGQDITNLITNFSRPGDPADRNWLKSDTAGGIFGRGDGNVDGQDITDLISNFTGDPGPATDGTAAAEYNPATGEFRIFADGVMSWSLISDGDFTDAGLAALSDVLPLGDASNLASLNENTVGEGGFGGTMSYADVALGAIVPAGTNPSRLTLQYVTGFGADPQIGPINVVPEPGTLAMLLAAALGAILVWRRRKRVP